jgi:hypothetical protein
MTTLVRSVLVLCLLFVGMLAVPGQRAEAQEETVRQTKEVEAFVEVAFAVPGTVHLRQGEPQSVEVEGSDATLAQVEVEVEEETLHIRTEGAGSWLNWFGMRADDPEGRVDVYVTVPTIEGLSIAGAGDVVGETPIRSDELVLRNAGSGRFDLDVEADAVEVQIAGSGTTRLRGRTDRVLAEIAGSGNMEAVELETASAEVSIAGSGNVQLTVTDRLSAQVMGSGNVRYRGSPRVDTSVMGSGTVEAME